MALPEGFVLEDKQQAVNLPEGFQLEESSAAKQQPEMGVFETALKRPLDVLEVPIAIGANMVTGPVTYLSGALGKEAQQAVARNIQYEPRGELAKGALEWLGKAAEASKIPPYMPEFMGVAPVKVPAAGEVKAASPFPTASTISKRTSQDYARGAQIDAAAEAQRLGLALSPEHIQPTAGPKILSSLAGESGINKIAEANKTSVREIALKDLGLPPETQLNGKAAFNKARSQVAGPYAEIRQLPTMAADEKILASLKALIPDETLIATEQSAKNIKAMVERATNKVAKGVDGNELLRDIEQLRKTARRIYANKNADLAALDKADASIGIANTLEGMIESNISNPNLLDRFRESRRQMAKIYAYEDATNFNTGIVDATKLSKITAKDNALSGDIKSLGQVAGNFPEAFTASATTQFDKTLGHIKRSGLAGTLGGLTGYVTTGGYGGAALGSVLGAAGGELSQSLAASKIASPSYQAALRLRDYRVPVSPSQAVGIPPIPQSQSVVPYQAPVEVLNKGEGPYQPNFTMSPNQYGPRVTPVMPEGQGLLSGPSAQGTLGSLRAEDARRAAMSRTLGQQQEAQMAAAEAASRKPASRGVVLDIDPFTGRITESSQGIRGATPVTFSDFGSSLKTASDKVTQGKNFDMTAAEKVAWDKTRVDMAEVAPGFKTLSDKAIAEKILDREWVAKTAQKAREKAEAFKEIAKKSANMKALQEAMMKRERMLDLAEQMEESLRASRPDVSSKQQGPKTRAAFRENLMSAPDLTGLFEGQ